MDRRNFLGKFTASVIASGGIIGWLLSGSKAKAATPEGYNPQDHYYGMGINIDQCIGCGQCMEACRTENHVPTDFFCRTWVERYTFKTDGEVLVENIAHNPEAITEKDILRSFFVPKLCNQCENAPCVQVCPVEATFKTEDGVILVDENRCIGCRYCVQACPYGARYIHPEKHVADKCTFCYHRITKGLLPACVEVCPTQARVFGDMKKGASPLARLRRMFKTHVLKPGLNTQPKVFYANLDGEVR
ncbi:MAG: 4Fe-4S dicluster domain-containing protein [Gemmatimonadetes bacterium]|nr:MAG: 4Fe-4S dicluster domain-containing protein [Gemmatimonadota bacterium]